MTYPRTSLRLSESTPFNTQSTSSMRSLIFRPRASCFLSVDVSAVGILVRSQVDTFLAAVLVFSILAKDHEQIARDEQKTQVVERTAVPVLDCLPLLRFIRSRRPQHMFSPSDIHLVSALPESMCGGTRGVGCRANH